MDENEYSENEYSDQELKLTAAIYATNDWVVDTIRQTGKLPEEIPNGGVHIAMKVIIRKRGTDITLSEDEKIVYEAILREGRLPGGVVRLVSQSRFNNLPDKEE